MQPRGGLLEAREQVGHRAAAALTGIGGAGAAGAEANGAAAAAVGVPGVTRSRGGA